MDPVSFVTASLSTRLSLPFTRRRPKPVLKPGRFENALKCLLFLNRYAKRKGKQTSILDSAWENFCLMEQFFGRRNASRRMKRKL